MALASSALVRVAPALATCRASRAPPRRGLMIVAGAKGAHVLVVEMAERGRSGREDL